MAFRLAECFVEFTAKGASAVKGAIDTVALSISGFTLAGLHGTAQGELLSFMFGELSREIASLFLPAIEMATDILGKTVDWFRSLDEAGQNMLGTVGMVIVATGALGQAFVALGIKVNLATAGIAAILGGLVAFFTMTETGRGLFASLMAPLEKIVNIIGPPLMKFFEGFGELLAIVVVPAVKVLAWQLELVAKAMEFIFGQGSKKASGAHRSVSLSGGQMESLTGTYQRLQQAALKFGRDPAERTADNTERIANKLDGVKESVDKVQPAIVR